MTQAQPQPARADTPQRASVDIMIPTLNERVNLPHALRSVMGWANKVIVLDSGSTDGTQDLARAMGAEVVEHPWEGYARQKNWGLDNLPFESEWIFILDADEAITPMLRDEIIDICSRPAGQVEEAGFYVNRYLVFLGKRIRHCGYFPSWNLRLFKRGKARYEDRLVHEHMMLQGKEGYLKGLMSHEDRRGLEYYIAKHNRYSTLEAEMEFQGRMGREGLRPSLFGSAVERKRFFRSRVVSRMPMRFMARFCWMYFLNLGVLDGLTGLRFCQFISTHEFFAELKLREMRLRAKAGEQWRMDDTLKDMLPPAMSLSQQSAGGGSGVEVQGSGSRRREAEPGTASAEPSALHCPPSPETIAQRAQSTWSLWEKIMRVVWMLVWATLFRYSFHNFYRWRAFLLRCFGAKIGKGVHIRPTVWVEIPWNLEIADHCAVGDDAILYSLGKITIGRLATVSQYAHLCTGTHDHTIRAFPLITYPIHIGEEAWVAADAFIGPGVTIGDRALVGARATVMKDVPADTVVAGNPARCIGHRILRDGRGSDHPLP